MRDVVDAYGKEGLVEIALTAEDVVKAAERLRRRPREAWLERVDARLATGSWDGTWAAMQAMIDSALAATACATPRLASAT